MSIKQKLINIFRIFIFILTSIGIIIFFRWIGLKGVLGFSIGMGLMAYVLLSQNQYLKFIIDLTNSKQYLWEIMNDGKKKYYKSTTRIIRDKTN